MLSFTGQEQGQHLPKPNMQELFCAIRGTTFAQFFQTKYAGALLDESEDRVKVGASQLLPGWEIGILGACQENRHEKKSRNTLKRSVTKTESTKGRGRGGKG